MINRPNNWDSVQAPSGREQLPPGGYVIVINAVEVKRSKSGYEYIDLSIDIAEGDYKGFYHTDFYAQDGDKRWRGHYRQWLPQNDQSASYFKGMVTAIEESNPGYTWDWNEKGLVGRIAGCLFRAEEWEYNGHTGMRTAPMSLCSADRIRKGDFSVPNPKMLQAKAPVNGFAQQTQQMPHGFEAISDDAIPF